MSFGPRHTECHLLFSRHISCPYFWHVSTMDAACDQFPAWSCPLKRAVYSTPDSQCLECYIYRLSTLQCESKKSPPYGFQNFFPKRLGIFNQFLHTYYVIISTACMGGASIGAGRVISTPTPHFFTPWGQGGT